MPYDFTRIERKWQDYWIRNRTFRALDPQEAGQKPKAYVLDMFPYPSGAGLHVGHPEGYTATDIICRYLRMKGCNVLHPMGWDAFGLPAEQYAIKTATHPRVTTEQNIATFRRQIQMLGLSYDWDREVDTTDPDYYRWTQWIFLQLFNSYFDPVDKKAKPISHLLNELQNENFVVAPDGEIRLNPVQEGMEPISGEVRVERLWTELPPDEQRDVIDGQRLAYMDEVPVNWCGALGTVLANEEVIDGKSEIGGFPVERRPMRQWMLRITAYADRLLEDLDHLEWPHSLKEMQRNWIGKSVGADVDFEVASSDAPAQGSTVADEDRPAITVFTTRPDTLYGATYMVLAPEHPLVGRITTDAQRAAVEEYRAQVAGRPERERLAGGREKTGVFTGGHAVNPVNKERIPIYIADYVLTGYGTGAIMAVPAHDDRDFEFARKYGLPIRAVVMPPDEWLMQMRPKATSIDDLRRAYVDDPTTCAAAFTGDGIAINSPVINGLPTPMAQDRITDWLSSQNLGVRSVNYKLRDWLFSRQRYWGEPFPILLDEDGNATAVDESELPVRLPDLEDFKPTGTPEPPLSKATAWRRVERDGKVYLRETNTMPQWAGSCWYYLRYLDPKNADRFVDPAREKYWMSVDLYVGGVEHAVLHLLYSRFWHKVLFDLGHVSTPEPFRRLVNQGLILGEMEFHVFEDERGRAVSLADLRDVAEEATEDGARLVAFSRRSGAKVSGRRIAEDQVEKSGDTYRLRSDPAIRVDARSFKMSKSRGNVVNPDRIVEEYGADCFRLYEMYLGPLEASKPWNTRDIVGMSRFLGSVWRNLIGDEDAQGPPAAAAASPRIVSAPIGPDLDRILHRTIKKVGEDIEAMRFNTAIAQLIMLNNAIGGQTVPRELARTLALLLAPFAPHMAEELWQRLGHDGSLAYEAWPICDQAKLVEATMELPVQVNGKLRDRIVVAAQADEDHILRTAEASAKARPWLEGKRIVKRLYVPGKLVNIVVQ
jgi:leucyl-tRNA synthetase